MRLTTKTRYGMRAIVELAMAYTKGPVAVSAIARKEGISKVYLEQLLNKLKRKGIVKSIRGARGGYILAADPAEIAVYDIISIMEGNFSLGFCISEENGRKTCDRTDICITKSLWRRIDNAIKQTLSGMTLKELCNKEVLL